MELKQKQKQQKKQTAKNNQEKLKKAFTIAFALVLLIVMASNVCALGVAPSREIIDFKEGKQTLSARIINNEHQNMRVAIYPKGELANYTTIGQSIIEMADDEYEKTFEYTLDLPSDLEPGTKNLGIIILQLPEAFAEGNDNLLVTDEKAILFNKKEEGSMISATTAVIHELQVRVPYPESHLEGKLHVSQGKVGDKFTFTVSVANRGTKPAEVYADIVIKGPTNEEISSVKTEAYTVQGGQGEKLVGEWTADVNEGAYMAEAIVHYGEKYFMIRQEFFVGNLFVSVEDLSVQGFKLGGIAKFDIGLKNKWNQEVKDVYGELKILDEQGQGLATVNTLSTDLPGYGEDTISGYWDTTGVEVGNYDVNVMLHYAGKTTEKLFNTIVSIDKITVGQIGVGKVTGGEDGNGSLLSILLIVIIVLIIVNIGWFVFFRKKFRRPKSQVQEQKIQKTMQQPQKPPESQ